jgi:hypothetical protein
MQIAAKDKKAMNDLLKQALKTATPVDSIVTNQNVADHAEAEAVREAVVKEDKKEEAKTAAKNEGNQDPQAFDDHKEYLDILESILKDDETESWDPNEPKLD